MYREKVLLPAKNEVEAAAYRESSEPRWPVATRALGEGGSTSQNAAAVGDNIMISEAELA